MNKREFVQKVIICMADTTAALQFIQDSGKYVDKIKHGLTDAEYLERMNKVKTAFNVNAVSLTCSETPPNIYRGDKIMHKPAIKK